MGLKKLLKTAFQTPASVAKKKGKKKMSEAMKRKAAKFRVAFTGNKEKGKY